MGIRQPPNTKFAGAWTGAQPLHLVTDERLHWRQTHSPKISVPYSPIEGHRKDWAASSWALLGVTPGEPPRGPREPLTRC